MNYKIAIMSTGTVGAPAGAHMARAGEDVTFIDPWLANVETMKAQGLKVSHTRDVLEWSTPVRRQGEGYNAAWRSDPELAYAGITTGTGIHAIDLLRFVLADEVTHITALTDAANPWADRTTGSWYWKMAANRDSLPQWRRGAGRPGQSG